MSLAYPKPLGGQISPAGQLIPLPPDQVGDGQLEPVILPFDTNLRLSDARLDWLIDRTRKRIAEVELEMGRTPEGTIAGSWMWHRERNQACYDKDFRWREALGESVFSESNFPLGDANQFVRALSARVRSDLLGTRPFFCCFSVPGARAQVAQQVEEYVQNRIEESEVTEALREAVRAALVRNEAVVKTTYRRQESTFIGPARVMVDDQTGRPVLTPERQLYVYEKDDLVPDPYVQGLYRLEKDPSFTLSAGEHLYATIRNLPQKLIQYDNVESKLLEYRDFLCPLKCTNIADADINVHLYETTPEALKAMYPDINVADAYFQWRTDWSGQKTAKFAQGETDERQSSVLETVRIAECYIRCDADNDGSEEEIFLVLDVENKKAIFYDYLGNHMSRRPFSVVVGVEQDIGRWYGIGVFEKMMHTSLYADAQLNRINLKDSKTGSITLMHKGAIEEVKNAGQIKFGSKYIYHYAPGWDPSKPALERINLNEDTHLGTELMNKMQAQAAQEFAIIGNATASALDLNESHTATGVRNVEQDSNVVTIDTEIDMGRGGVDVLEIAVDVLLENMNPVEMMYSKDGAELALLNRDEIRTLPRQVRLLLTKTRSADMLSSNKEAETVCLRYWNLTPPQKKALRAVYMRELRGLEIDDADDLLPAVTDADVQAWQQQQQQAQPTQPSESISIRLPDLVYSERAQALQKVGITPGTPEEVGAQKTSNMAIKISEKQAGRQPPAPANV